MEILHAEFGHGAKDPTQHLGPGQGQNKVEEVAWRCGLLQLHRKDDTVCVDTAERADADQPIETTDVDRVTHLRMQLTQDVAGAMVVKMNLSLRQPVVGVAQQDQIHRV